MGRVNLRLIDATERPSKPVYLRYEILRRRSRDQSGAVRGVGLDLDLDLDLDLEPASLDPSISDLIYIH